MSTLSRFLTLLAPFCLAGCPIPEVAHCADYDLCPASSGSTAVSTGGDPMLPTGEVQTVTSAGEVTTTTTTTAAPSTTGDPVVPSVLSVMFTPEPLEQVGIIDVEVVAEDADHVRMDRPGFESVELTKGPDVHFHGAIEILSGLSNGTHEASFVPRQEGTEGTPEIGYYTVALPEAGSEILWDVVPDDGLGQVDALAVLGDDAIVGLGTVFDGNNTPHCYAHRRNLDGSYSGADVQVLFPEYPCTAVDIEIVGDTIDLLVTVTGGDGPRWRLATMVWGQAAPTVLRTGEKDEVARALARDTNGKRVVCGTDPSPGLMDKIDGRVWTLNGPSSELDYRPTPEWHVFDETVMDCTFRGDQLVLVGEVYGPHEETDPPTWRKRPFMVELDGQGGEPHWIVSGLGPGNTTQGGASTLVIDDQGRAVVGLYTCADACDPEPELRLYEPGGGVVWQVTLPAEVSVPFDLTWSPAGYAVIAGAHGTGNTTQFLLQGYVPHTYGPAWTFVKGKQAGLHVAFAVAATPDVVVGAGLGTGGYPAFAFVEP
ncbi:hypothetical protein SAMN02745121_08770 [Nannocystis exedens]|uniref:Uncharacterized protein n=1 Tax=Nannocystis exedens TaxID=54 RepID=A0A1I2IJ66_9BACT|nr:hypothetical protein [Nannocystis exedens]PCC69301.1 hypothetical protein NAEX_02323 [Nannocystis exedens]SFF42345.1 hypothetical protein SAMN02745121_08770 [Nannocystis exedens]